MKIVILLFCGVIFSAFADTTFSERLELAARERLNHVVVYDGAYRSISYPMGDVPDTIGVCTDVIIRSYRSLNIDLQKLVHEDMKRRFHEYPRNWGLTSTDRNIDHRRVPNLQCFFAKHGKSLPVSENPDDYLPGDMVTWMLPGNLPHIGFVSSSKEEGVPLIIHNVGAGPQIEDFLFWFPITGHYRYFPVQSR